MQYLSKDEIRRVLEAAYEHSKRDHLMMVVSLWHGLRVSELVNLRGTSFTTDGMLIVARLKGSNQTSQPIHRDDNALFDETPVLAFAAEKKSLRLFELTPRHLNRLMAKYCVLANVHASKAHWHVWKHSTGMLLWDTTQNLGQIQSFLGHKSSSSTLCYLYEADSRKASNALAAVRF